MKKISQTRINLHVIFISLSLFIFVSDAISQHAVINRNLADQAYVVDLVSEEIIDSIDTGLDPIAIAVAEKVNKLFIANNDEATISSYHLDSKEFIENIEIPTLPISLRTNYHQNKLYSKSIEFNRWLIIDTESLQIIDTLELYHQPIYFGKNRNYFFSGNEIRISDIETDSVILSKSNPFDSAFEIFEDDDEEVLYLKFNEVNHLIKANPTELSVIDTIFMEVENCGSSRFSQDFNFFLCSDYYNHKVHIFNLVSQEKHSLDVGNNPTSLDISLNDIACVTSFLGNSIAILKKTDGQFQLSSEIPIDDNPNNPGEFIYPYSVLSNHEFAARTKPFLFFNGINEIEIKSFQNKNNIESIRIYDAMGRFYYGLDLPNSQAHISIAKSHFAKGISFIRIRGNGEEQIFKWIGY